MCMVSNAGSGYQDLFPQRWPQVPQHPVFPIPEISRVEFEALRSEVQELRKLLEAAKKFDEATNQPDCEMEQKVKFLRQIAEAVGVSLDDVLAPAVPVNKD